MHKYVNIVSILVAQGTSRRTVHTGPLRFNGT